MNLKKNSKNLSINNLFFELIRVSIGVSGCLSKTPTTEEWKELYEMAKKQSLVGVCFAGVQRLQLQEQCPPEMLYLTWMGMAAKIQQRNEVVNRQCVDLQKRLSADGLRSYIMKGQAVASLYKVSEGFKFQKVSGGSINDNSSNNSNLSQLRQSGDIDIYLEGGFEKVNEYVQRTYPTKEINELEIHYPCFADPSTGSGEPTEVEIHFKPFVMDGPKDRILQRFFDSCREENFSNKVSLGFSGFQEVPGGRLEICAPTLKFNLVHQLVHIHHHLFYEGVGMRQLMDYHFVVKHEMEVKKGSDVRKVREVVDSLGLNKFASALMWVIGYVFDPGLLETWNLKPETTLWKPNEKDGKFLLSEIMLSGNFGKQDERQQGLYDSKWNSFWMVHMKTFRMWRFDHWAWLWSPIWRIKGFVWRKLKGYK